MTDVPVFITYRDRRSMLDRCLSALIVHGFRDITVIDNGSAEPFTWERIPEFLAENMFDGIKVVRSDNAHRQLAPWLLDLVPDDRYYIVTDCDIELDRSCPSDVAEHLIRVLEDWPEIPKIGLGIRTDDFLFPPPQHYAWSYLMEYSVEDRYRTIDEPPDYGHGDTSIIDAPTDTTFAMYRPGTGWPGIVGARTTAPYLCRHLPWYNEEYTDEERLYYSRVGKAWTMGHSAESLLDLVIAVPFTELRAETTTALTGKQVTYAPMLSFDSYFDLLRDLWVQGRSFAIIEHDIVVNETTIDELRVCEEDWCAMPFPYRGNPRSFSLACSRFSEQIIARHPDLMEVIAQMHDEKHPPKHWCRLDAWIWQVLTERGEKRHDHVHSEAVGHIGPQEPKHGCLR